MNRDPVSTDPSSAAQLALLVERVRDVFRRRRLEFIVFFGVTFLVVHATAFFLPGRFEAQAALLIQPPRSTPPLRSDPDQPATVVSEGVTEEAVQSEAAIITSYEVLAATVDATGLDRAPTPWYLRVLYAPIRAYEYLYALHHEVPYPSPRDRAIRGLGESLTVAPIKDSHVVVVTHRSAHPKVAQIVLGELLENYLARHLEVNRQEQLDPFLTSQADILERSLTEYEEELRRIRATAGVVDVDREREIQLQIDADLREEHQLLQRRRAELDGVLARYTTQLSAGFPAASSIVSTDGPFDLPPVVTPRIDELKGEILQLDLAQVGLENRYSDDFPLVAENRRKLEMARAALNAEEQNLRQNSPALVDAFSERAKRQAEMDGVLSRLAVLETQMARSRGRLEELDLVDMESDRGLRRLESTEERYRILLTLGERARVEEALDRRLITNVSVVQAPAASPKPVSPKKTIVLLVSVVGGLLAAILGLLILEARRVGMVALLEGMVPRVEG